MQKISILALHLGYGGVEKSITVLANMLAETKDFEVEVISIYKLYEQPVFDFHPDVKITYLIDDDIAERVKEYKLMFFHFHYIKLFKRLYQDYFSKLRFLSFFKDAFGGIFMYHKRKSVMKKAIVASDANIIISTRTFLNDLLSLYGGDHVLKIGWEHNHHHHNMKYALDVVSSSKRLDYLVLVSHDLCRFYQRKMISYPCKCVYIPNTLDKIPRVKSPLKEKRLVSVGRLSSEKGQFDLLKVYQLVLKRYPDWVLDIVGDGPERGRLEQYCKDAKIDDKVTFHGYQKTDYIDKLLHQSSIYVMTSYTESFGIVLLEAMSHGLPCLAYDSAEGAREIITSGSDGYLIKNRNEQMMVRKINDLIKDKEKRVQLGSNGRKKVKMYSRKSVLEQWLKILKTK